MLVRLGIICLTLTCLPSQSFGGVKDEFIKAAMAQCNVTKETAAKMATKGRTGNVFKFRMCLVKSLNVSDECRITCTQRGAKIGK